MEPRVDPASIVIIGIAIFGFVYWVSKQFQLKLDEQQAALAQSARETLMDAARTTVRKYVKTLSIRRQQLSVKGDYDKWDFKGWYKHVDDFIETVIKRDAKALGIDVSQVNNMSDIWSDLVELIDLEVDAYEDANPPSNDFAEVTDGVSYERYVKRLLEDAGWEVKTTPASGDQGADLIAEKNETTFAIQCKLYTGAVGNAAVQEVVAAKAFYRCDFACVVTNSTFTPAARALALSNGVTIVHHDEIVGMLDAIVGD